MMTSDSFSTWLAGSQGDRIVRSRLPAGLDLPTAAGILGTIDCGLLSAPYLEVLRDGGKLPRAALFTSRRVQNQKVPGFIHRRNVLTEFRSGATLRFPCAHHWMPSVRDVTVMAQDALGTEIAATAYLVAGQTAAAIAGSHAGRVLIQCSGTATWRIGGQQRPDGERTITTAPRDVICLPASAEADAVAGDDDCLVVVLARPAVSVGELVAALAERTRDHLDKHAALSRHHLMPAAGKAEWVRQELRRFYSGIDPDDLVRGAREAS